MLVIRCFLFTLLGMGLIGCSSYRRAFDTAVAESGGIYADFTGPWMGDWESGGGHDGPLWCLVSPMGQESAGAEQGSYQFYYRAGWERVLYGNFRHTVPVVRNRDGSVTVEGRSDLGKLGGIYSIRGVLTETRFDATYSSTLGDKGRMTLRRIAVESH